MEESVKVNPLATEKVERLILKFSIPAIISMLVSSLYNIVDSFFVAQINEQAMTALSLVFPVQNFVNATAIGFGVGINAMIAFHLGAGNKGNANASATHGMILSVIHGFLALIISIAIMPTFLGAFTKDENVIKLGLEYSRIVFLFAPVIMISLAFEKIFQAVGRMNETMFALLCGCISNIILDPLLIFGIGFFPKLGIKGAALATGIGQIITVIVYLIYYVKKPLPVKLKKSCLPLQRSLDFRLYTIGVPAILNLALPSFLVSFLNGILSAYSDIYVVVLGIYYKLQTFLYLPASGIVQGMRPVIGYNYGAGEMDRVRKIFRLALPIIIQNLFSAAISSADVIMLNSVGQSAAKCKEVELGEMNLDHIYAYEKELKAAGAETDKVSPLLLPAHWKASEKGYSHCSFL